MTKDEMYDEITRLIDEYGNAEYNFGDYNSRNNLNYVMECQKDLLEKIEFLLDKAFNQ